LTKKVARVFLVKPIYILILNTAVLLSAGFITLFPLPEFDRTYRNYQLVGLEIVKDGHKIQTLDLASQNLFFKLEPNNGFYQLKAVSHQEASSFSESVGSLAGNQLSILLRKEFSVEIVAQSNDGCDTSTTIRYYLAKKRMKNSNRERS